MAKTIGDINEQVGRMLNRAGFFRSLKILRIGQQMRDNINDRLQSVEWPRRANIKVSYGARTGNKFAPLASKGNSNS